MFGAVATPLLFDINNFLFQYCANSESSDSAIPARCYLYATIIYAAVGMTTAAVIAYATHHNPPKETFETIRHLNYRYTGLSPTDTRPPLSIPPRYNRPSQYANEQEEIRIDDVKQNSF